jgi:hypothetical protein
MIASLPTAANAPADAPYLTIGGKLSTKAFNGPSSDYGVAINLGPEDQVLVLGTNAGQSWLYVEHNGSYGWLSLNEVSASGINLDDLPVIDIPSPPSMTSTKGG